MKTTTQRSEVVMFKLSQDEKDQLVKIATSRDMNMSELFRRIMLPMLVQWEERRNNVSK